MKKWKLILILLVLIGLPAAAYMPAANYMKQRRQPTWRTAAVKQGRIVSVVNSSGRVRPVLSVSIGSFVSGPIEQLFVDFNQEVKKDEELARIDDRLYIAAQKSAEAVLATAEADVRRIEALLQQAKNDEARALALQEENEDFISDSEIDQYMFGRMSLEAQLDVAKASIEQAQASLDNSDANVGYTHITSPVDGIIIDRKIDEGQTLAANFQTPELFVVAPRMREEMHIHASVDEADIGLIRDAQEKGQPVQFTVDAYPDDLFEGVIEEIRFSSTELQNVVTYPVVVAAANPELKLLPGMTASISFRVEEREDVLKIPNASLRFYPDKKHVRKEDHKILEGGNWEEQEDDDQEIELSAEEKAEARKKRNRRHVWVEEGDKLKAVAVETGISDSKFTELVSGELTGDQKLVTGIEPKKGWGF